MQSSDRPHDKNPAKEKEMSDALRPRHESPEWTSTQRIGDSLHQFADEAISAAAPGAERLGQRVKGAAEQISDMADAAVRSLGDGSERLLESSEEMTAACRRYVKDHPLLAISIAVGAGVLLGRLLDSR